MGKVNLLVKYCLINEKNEYNIKGIFLNDEIKFLDKTNKMILNVKKNTLKRITEQAEILFNFNLHKCYVFDKISKTKFRMEIEVLQLKNLPKYFYVKYKIEDNLFEMMIKII